MAKAGGEAEMLPIFSKPQELYRIGKNTLVGVKQIDLRLITNGRSYFYEPTFTPRIRSKYSQPTG